MFVWGGGVNLMVSLFFLKVEKNMKNPENKDAEFRKQFCKSMWRKKIIYFILLKAHKLLYMMCSTHKILTNI